MAKISDFDTTAPYEAEYIDINEIIGKAISIIDVTPFENNKGKGIHALIECEGKEYRLCTHGIVLVDRLTRTEVLDTLKTERIDCKIVRVASGSDKSRQVLKLEDA